MLTLNDTKNAGGELEVVVVAVVLSNTIVKKYI